MRKTTTARVTTVALLTACLFSCQKELDTSSVKPMPGVPKSQDIQANYPGFDWDNPAVTTMPVSTNSPTVYVPWRSNGGTPLDPGIVNDYHKSDGWELVFDTFSPDNFPNAGNQGAVATSTAQPAGGLYFALYNRYRGILRYYLYIPPGLFGNSTQLEHGLQVYTQGNTSKLLNFEGADIVDVNNNSAGFTKTSKDGVSTTGGWYAMQYQIAYDPAFAGTTFPNPGFRWDTYSVNLTQISLNGTEVGTTKGTITSPQVDLNWANIAANGLVGIAEIFASGVTGSSTGPFTALQQAAQGGLSGSASGILSGLFGGSSASSQTVDLTMNSTITTTGTATSNQPYELNSMPFPSQIAGSNGVPPLISHSLGLFTLPARPSIKVHTTRTQTSGPSGTGYQYSYQYTFDSNAVYNTVLNNLNTSVFNSDPSTGATVSKFKAEIVIVDPDTNSPFTSSGKQETIGNHTVYTGGAVQDVYSVVHGGAPSATGQQAAIRISFYVQPNSGAPAPFIVKTFLADVTAN